MMKRIIKTPMLTKYLIKFFIRITIFLVFGFLYLTNKSYLSEVMNQPIWMGVTVLHVLWLIFMVMMLTHIFPTEKLTMALRKAERSIYTEPENYSEAELLHFIQDQNVKAWKIMLFWLSFNAVFGVLYLMGVIENIDLLMLTVFYFLCDYICILLFCPFQSLLMKNRCCVNCRIYDWGHFMMFTPMLFIRNFYSWSLFFTSCVVLIKWEITFSKHPERFWSGSNTNLQCANCKDKTCQIKRALSYQGTEKRGETDEEE